MATSTHSTILVFLAAYAAIAWPLMSRWALWRDLAAAPEEWRRDERAREIPSRRAVAASLAAADIATAQRPRVAGLEPSASEGHADAEDELAATAEASTGAGAARRTGWARAT